MPGPTNPGSIYTDVVRADTWRKPGNPGETMAAFQCALGLEPTNWSLFFDVADLSAEQGDFACAGPFPDGR